VIDIYLSTNSLCCHLILICFSGVPVFLAGGEDFWPHIAAGFGPFVVLLRKDGADEPDDGIAAREDPDYAGAAAYLLVEPFLRVVGPDLPPDLAGERGERQDVLAGVIEMGRGGGELGLQRGDDLVVLGADGAGVGLLEDGADQRGYPGLRGLGDLGGEISRVVKP
jgi:hypothetical protein